MNKAKIKNVVRIVLNNTARFYPYFFAFYLISLILSLFWGSYRASLNWSAFLFSVIVLGILSLFSQRVRAFISSRVRSDEFGKKFDDKKDALSRIMRSLSASFAIAARVATDSLKRAAGSLKRTAEIISTFSIQLVKRLRRKDYIKLGLMAIILIYAVHAGAGIFGFLVLAYALAAFLYVLDSRIPAGLALLFLIACPISIALKKETLAEALAIYAYYFLVIAVVSQIIEYVKDRKPSRNEAPEAF